MSDEKRESKIDINDLLDKYLNDDAHEADDVDDAAKSTEQVRSKRRAAARRVPGDVASELREPAADGDLKQDSDDDAITEEAVPAQETGESVEGSEPSDESVSAEPEEGAQDVEAETVADPDADTDTDTDTDTDAADSKEQPYTPDAEMFAQYEAHTDSESYDYIDESTGADAEPENSSGQQDDAAADDAADGGADPDDDMDDFDMNILLGLGMEEELEQSVGTERVTKFVEKQQTTLHKTESVNRERAALDYEYTTKSQTREVIAMYNNAHRAARLKLTAALALTVLLLLFEGHSLFGITLGGAFDPLMYPVVYIMVGLQLTLLTAAFAWKQIYTGLLDFFRGKPTPECVAVFALLIDIIYSALISFSTSFGENGPATYNLPVAIMFVMLYIHNLINIRREKYSFGVISSKKRKYALSCMSMADAHLEHEAFSDLMESDDKAEDIGVLKVEGADFVGDYFLRTNRYVGGRKFIGFLIPAVIVAAAAFFAYKYNGTGVLTDGAGAAVSVALLCLPVSVFYMFSHPLFRAIKKAREDDSTIIGESSVEEYANAAIISFDDKNVFPSTGVTVRGINIFGNHMIDRVLYTAASVFCTIGGPLSDVFDIATRDIGHSDNVELGRCLPGLLEANVDGVDVMFGSIDTLEASGIRIPRPIDEHRNDEFGDTVSVMYMVENGRFTARMLIQYLADSDFEFTLKQLDRSGMFVGIKTFDPNVTEEFLGRQIKLKNYPVRVIRCKSLDDRIETTDTTVSGIVSKDSPKPLLQTVTLCEKVLHARSINTMLVVISLLVSFVLAALSVLFGASVIELSPVFITVYQLFWIIPMYVVSRMIVS